jgi:hypothetical protein
MECDVEDFGVTQFVVGGRYGSWGYHARGRQKVETRSRRCHRLETGSTAFVIKIPTAHSKYLFNIGLFHASAPVFAIMIADNQKPLLSGVIEQ